MEKLKQAFQDQDIQTIQFIGHAMKGEAKTFNFTDLSVCCEQLENCQDISQVSKLIQQLSDELNPVLQSLEAQVARLG